MSSYVRTATACALVLGAVLFTLRVRAVQRPQRAPTFHAGTDLVRVDVVVRDKDGAVVRGLTANDFLISEDGKPQQITSFDFEEIAVGAVPAASTAPALLNIEQLQKAAAQRNGAVTP